MDTTTAGHTTGTTGANHMPLADVVRKIAALRRLAAGAGTPEEAAAAAAKAQELMFAYNIAEASVEGAGQRSTDPTAGFQNHEGVKAASSWEYTLLRGLARANFCHLITSRRTGFLVYRLVGTEANVAAVIDTYDWLRSIINRLSRLSAKEAEQSGELAFMRSTPTKWGHGFRVGASEVIADRLTEQRAASEREAKAASAAAAATTTTALAIIDNGVKAAVAAFYPNLSHARGRSGGVNSWDGRQAGRAAGASLGLSKPGGHLS